MAEWLSVGLFVFRVDSSLAIGSGHVMRCLTLADALKAQGADCHFISRAHPGHLMDVVHQRGYKVNSLAAQLKRAQDATKKIAEEVTALQQEPTQSAWLGSTWQADAHDTATIVASLQPDWLIVDHYALDARWEASLASYSKKLMVIDDLADRPHHCDLLLDQNLGRQPAHYAPLVPAHCQVLTGPHYALLRPEFGALRPYSLQRRKAQPALRHLLITMGGVDQPNATGQVLQVLKTCALPADCRITVVMGPSAPWLQQVQGLAAKIPRLTEVLVNIDDMAQRMADSDLAIGAAGGTSWERCCLGLPSLIVVLAENQHPGAQALKAAQAARLLGELGDIATQLPLAIAELVASDCLSRTSLSASTVADGYGVDKVLLAMGCVNA